MKSKLQKCLALFIPFALGVTDQAFAATFSAGSDAFASAPAITSESNYSDPTSLFTFTSEAGEPGQRPDGAVGAQKTAWWKWTATQNGFCTVDTLRTGQSTDGIVDSVIAVYTGSAVSTLTRVAGNDDASLNVSLLSTASFYALAGTTYYIAVDGFSPSSITAANSTVVLQLRLLPLKIATRAGVIAGGNPQTAAGMGIATITTTATGSLSGKLTLANKAYPFTGIFSVDGYYQTSFARTAPANSPPLLPITLKIDGTGGGALAVGVDNGFYGGNFPEKAVFSVASPNTMAGLYPTILAPATNVGGNGVLSITVAASGMATASGYAMDGTAITFSSALYKGTDAANFVIPGFVSLAAGKGGFVSNSGITESGATDILAGAAIYIRPVATSPATLFYPSGINTNITIAGSTYPKPVTGSRVLGFLDGTAGAGHLMVTNANAEIAADFSEALTLSTANKFTFTSLTRKPALTINTATGLVTGTITEPAGKARTLKGILTKVSGVASLYGYVTGTKSNLTFQVAP